MDDVELGAVEAMLVDVYSTGKNFRYLEAQPLTFPSAMLRFRAFESGASKRTLDCGFETMGDMNCFIETCDRNAIQFRRINGGELIADGERDSL